MTRKGGSGLFLMEMIAVVLFFILCASTCILVFVKSNNLSQKAKDTNQAVIACQNMAEILKTEGTAGLERVLSARKGTGDYYLMYWDKDWKLSDENSAAYEGQVQISMDGDLMKAFVSVSRKNPLSAGDLFAIDVWKYAGQEEAVSTN